MQNFLKRLYLILVTAVLVALLVVALLAPVPLGNWLIGTFSEMSVIVRAVLAVMVGGLLLMLTYLQVRRPAQHGQTGLVMKVSGAMTDVSIESARDRILKAVEAVPDVVSAEVDIKPVRGKADLELHVTVMGHGTKLPDKQKEINRALKQVINKQLGLQMAGRPRVHIQLYSEPGRAAAPVVVEPQPALPVVEPKVEPVASKPVPPVKAEPEKPAETPAPAAKTGNGGSLFGGWRRNRQEDEPPQAAPSAVAEEKPPVALEEKKAEPLKPLESTPAVVSPVMAVSEPDDDRDDIADDQVGVDTLILDDESQASARQQFADILGEAGDFFDDEDDAEVEDEDKSQDD